MIWFFLTACKISKSLCFSTGRKEKKEHKLSFMPFFLFTFLLAFNALQGGLYKIYVS